MAGEFSSLSPQTPVTAGNPITYLSPASARCWHSSEDGGMMPSSCGKFMSEVWLYGSDGRVAVAEDEELELLLLVLVLPPICVATMP